MKRQLMTWALTHLFLAMSSSQSAHAITLRWASGGADISATQAARCTLVVTVPAGQALPGEWRLTWVAWGSATNPIRVLPDSGSLQGARVCQLSDSSQSVEELYRDITATLCNAGSPGTVSRARYILDVAPLTKAKIKIAQVDSLYPAPGTIDSVTINGGTEQPFPPALFSVRTSALDGNVLVSAVGMDLGKTISGQIIRGSSGPLVLSNVQSWQVLGSAAPDSVLTGIVRLANEIGLTTQDTLVDVTTAPSAPAVVSNEIVVRFRTGTVDRPVNAQTNISAYTFHDANTRQCLTNAGVTDLLPVAQTFTHADTLGTNAQGDTVQVSDLTDLYVALYPGTVSPSSEAASLSSCSGVQSACPNFVLAASDVPSDPLFDREWWARNTGGGLGNYNSNPCYTGSSGVDIGAAAAWDLATTTFYGQLHVGIIDSGISAHPDLLPYVVSDDVFNSCLTTPTDDLCGHGTAIAGLVAARRNDGYGVAGVAGGAGIGGGVILHAVKVGEDCNPMDPCVGTRWTDLVAAIDHVSREEHLPIACIAIAGQLDATNPSDKTAIDGLNAACRDAKMRGTVLVVAAGNKRLNFGYSTDPTPMYPAFLGNRVFSIGAVLPDGQKWTDKLVAPGYCASTPGNAASPCEESNEDVATDGSVAAVDVCTPGGRFIVTTHTVTVSDEQPWITYDACIPGSFYQVGFGGTSASTGIAAGAVALLMSSVPGLSGEDAEQVLERTAVQTVLPQQHVWNNKYGWGMIKEDAALEFVSHNRIFVEGRGLAGSQLTLIQHDSVSITFKNVLGWPAVERQQCGRYILEGTIPYSPQYPGPLTGAVVGWVRASGTTGLDPRLSTFDYALDLPGAQIINTDGSGMTVRIATYFVPGHGWYPVRWPSVEVGIGVSGGLPTEGVASGSTIPELNVAMVPNPVRRSAIVDIRLPGRAQVELEIVDVQGRIVDKLATFTGGPGLVRMKWDPRRSGREIASGVYFCRLRWGSRHYMRRFVLL